MRYHLILVQGTVLLLLLTNNNHGKVNNQSQVIMQHNFTDRFRCHWQFTQIGKMYTLDIFSYLVWSVPFAADTVLCQQQAYFHIRIWSGLILIYSLRFPSLKCKFCEEGILGHGTVVCLRYYRSDDIVEIVSEETKGRESKSRGNT